MKKKSKSKRGNEVFFVFFSFFHRTFFISPSSVSSIKFPALNYVKICWRKFKIIANEISRHAESTLNARQISLETLPSASLSLFVK